MLQGIEKLILGLIQEFYKLPSVFGLLFLGGAAFVLLVVQYFHRDKRVFPGLLGIVLAMGALYHFFAPHRIVSSIDSILYGMLNPTDSLPPLPIVFEPLFSFFVAPLESRSLIEELIFICLVGYLISLGIHSYREYKKTGRIFGSLDIASSFSATSKRPQRSRSNELGSADLASTEQIANWTKETGANGETCLHVTNLRGSEGECFKQAKLVFPAERRNQHILAIAKTGGGKTSKLILPILYNDCMDPNRSTIVLDSKPEMWRLLAAMTRKYNPNKNIVLFNPLDVARSLSWNILSKIEDETDCKLIANTIIMATDQPSAKSDSPFFRNNALAILNSIMVGLLHDPSETLSMPRIHELVQSGMKPLCDWLERHPHAIKTSRTFVELARSGSQNADTIMSELGMRLSAWDLPAIRATTAQSELDVEDLVSKPSLFIIELRESELEMLRPMANVIVVELLRFLTKRAESCPGVKLPRPVSFVIDEFASALGRLPDIHVKLNTLRSRNISIVAAIQSIAQIKANYGDNADSVLAGFTTKILMPDLDNQDSEWASKDTGQMTIRFKTASEGVNKKIIEWFASKNDSTQEQVQQRAVLTPDEIGRPRDGIATFFLPSTPVFQGHLVPHYKIPEMLKRIQEFNSEAQELKLRTAPIDYTDIIPQAGPVGGGSSSSPNASNGGLPPGISNTSGWSDDQIRTKLDEVRKKLDWDNTTGSARKWWEAFESENKHRVALVLRLAEELANRNATITEFFLAYVYSNTDNIQANLHYLDYTRLKKEEEKKKREAAEQGKQAAA